MNNNISSSAGNTPKATIIQNNKQNNQLTNQNTHSSNNIGILSPSSNTNASKKTIYTKISEELINNLHKKGTIELSTCYDNLTKRKGIEAEMFTNMNTVKSNSSSSTKKIISNFLNRNAKAHNMKRVLPNSLSQKNGLIKSTVPLSSKDKNRKLQSKGKVRSPEKYLEDQIKFVTDRNKKIELHREELAKKEIENNQNKPKISKNSIEIAKRNIKNKNTVNRLFKDTTASSRKNHLNHQNNNENSSINDKRKSESLKKLNSTTKNNKTNNQKTVNKLYKEGILLKNKRSQSGIPSQKDKVSSISSRDFGNCNCHIRMNSKSDKPGTERSYLESTRNKNEEIIIKKVIKDIDKIIEMGSGSKDKVDINYFEFCELLYKLGCVENDHLNIMKKISNNSDNKYIDYEEHKYDIEKIKFDNNNSNSNNCIPINKSNFALQRIQQEQNIINSAWLCIINKFVLNSDNTLNKDVNIFNNKAIQIDDFKVFIILILNVLSSPPLSGRANTNNSISSSNRTLSPDNISSFHKNSLNQTTNPNILIHNSNSYKTIIKKVNSLQCKNLKQTFEYFKLTKKNKDSSLLKHPPSSNTLHSEFTFKPKITNPNARSINLEETYNILQQRHHNKMMELQKEKIMNELKECTFVPNNKKIDTSKSIEISNRLYNIIKKKKTETLIPTTSENDKECTFTPVTNSKINEEIFTINPLKNDPLVNYKVEQYEKARIEKKLMSYINYQGGPSVFKMKNSEELLKGFQDDHNYESFKFGIEHKTNKDTFDLFKTFTNKKNGSILSNENKRIMPLFTIEVKIKDHIEFLDYYKNDNPAEITRKFCEKYGLGENSNEKILSVIEDRLNNYDLFDYNNN